MVFVRARPCLFANLGAHIRGRTRDYLVEEVTEAVKALASQGAAALKSLLAYRGREIARLLSVVLDHAWPVGSRATEELAETWRPRKGETVTYRGCAGTGAVVRVVHVDESLSPPAYMVRREDGSEVNTELSRLGVTMSDDGGAISVALLRHTLAWDLFPSFFEMDVHFRQELGQTAHRRLDSVLTLVRRLPALVGSANTTVEVLRMLPSSGRGWRLLVNTVFGDDGATVKNIPG